MEDWLGAASGGEMFQALLGCRPSSCADRSLFGRRPHRRPLRLAHTHSYPDGTSHPDPHSHPPFTSTPLPPPPPRTPTRTRTPPRAPTPSLTPTETEIPTFTSAPTWTSRPTRTPTITPTPTYDYPDGRVLQQANCRYGPGAAYLFEWGLYPGDRVTIYNRNDRGTWLYVKPNTYRGRCWVSASLLEIHGDIFALDPFYSPLPYSTLYSAPRNVYASRSGNDVWIGWDAVWMTEDDYRGYLVEAWLWVGGEG